MCSKVFNSTTIFNKTRCGSTVTFVEICFLTNVFDMTRLGAIVTN